MTRRLFSTLLLLVTLKLAGCALVPLIMDKNVGYGTQMPTQNDQTMPSKR
jgi:hypothetical protein